VPEGSVPDRGPDDPDAGRPDRPAEEPDTVPDTPNTDPEQRPGGHATGEQQARENRERELPA
jgi:hypothetical protein